MLLQGFMIYCILLKICPFNQNKRIGKIVIILQMLGKVVILPYEFLPDMYKSRQSHNLDER